MYVFDGSVDYFFFDNMSQEVCFVSLEKDQIVYTAAKKVNATFFSGHTKVSDMSDV